MQQGKIQKWDVKKTKAIEKQLIQGKIESSSIFKKYSAVLSILQYFVQKNYNNGIYYKYVVQVVIEMDYNKKQKSRFSLKNQYFLTSMWITLNFYLPVKKQKKSSKKTRGVGMLLMTFPSISQNPGILLNFGQFSDEVAKFLT